MKRRTFVVIAGLLTACGAGREEAAAQPSDRCAHCGMHLAEDWLTGGARTAAGANVRFDTPKCLLAWLNGDGAGASDAWVTEYYARDHRPIAEVSYVIGSDLSGPMGADLIPVDLHRRDAFVRDHGGTGLDLATARARVAELFRY
jgi:nitrous oxide reductase accessory protein NosL